MSLVAAFFDRLLSRAARAVPPQTGPCELPLSFAEILAASAFLDFGAVPPDLYGRDLRSDPGEAAITPNDVSPRPGSCSPPAGQA